MNIFFKSLTTRSATIRYQEEKCCCTQCHRLQIKPNEKRSWISATRFMLIHQEVRLKVQQERSVGFILWGSWTEKQISFESVRLLLSCFFTHQHLCSLAGNKGWRAWVHNSCSKCPLSLSLITAGNAFLRRRGQETIYISMDMPRVECGVAMESVCLELDEGFHGGHDSK